MTHLTLEQVRRAVAGPRPGPVAQALMSPERRPDFVPFLSEMHEPREAGAIILLFTRENDLHFVLTRRTETVASHKGQVSLPGGAREGAERLEQTALREASEELGIDRRRIEIIGAPLTPLVIPVSGFRVTPFVGYYADTPRFTPEPGEVIELIQPGVGSLLDESCIEREVWEIRGEHVSVPFFRLGGHKVWGATAMMLSEFAVMLREQAI